MVKSLPYGTCGLGVYNPTTQAWFTSAPESNSPTASVRIDFKRETFTKKLALYFGSRLTSPSGATTIVSAALMLLSDVSFLLQSLTFGSSGFAALVDLNTKQTLVYGSRSPDTLYNDVTNTSLLLSQIDPSITLQSFSASASTATSTPAVSVVVKNGVTYYVAQVFWQFVQPLSSVSNAASLNSLVSHGQAPLYNARFAVLVYLPRDDYFTTYGQLVDAVTTSQKGVYAATTILCLSASRFQFSLIFHSFLMLTNRQSSTNVFFFAH